MMTGPLWSLSFFGQSSIVARAPHGLEEGKIQGWGYKDLGPAEGFIRVAASDCDEEILVVKSRTRKPKSPSEPECSQRYLSTLHAGLDTFGPRPRSGHLQSASMRHRPY